MYADNNILEVEYTQTNPLEILPFFDAEYYKIAFVLALVYSINVIVLVFVKSKTNALIGTFGFEAPTQLNVYVLLGSFLILLIIWSFQIAAVYRQIFKLALPLKK